MSQLRGKTVLITGASAGIGEACAYAFAAEGTRLLLGARRIDRLQKLIGPLQDAGALAVHSFSLDVQHKEAVQEALDALPLEWKAIDILINNAGLSRGVDKVYEAHIEDWDEMIDTNVKGLLYVTRAVVPGMVERGQGHVINMGSTAGEMTYPGGAVYCATKAAGARHQRWPAAGPTRHTPSASLPSIQVWSRQISPRPRFRGDEERAAKVYAHLTPLTPQDVAETIVWAASRPAHVNIARVLMTSIDQANSLLFNRKS